LRVGGAVEDIQQAGQMQTAPRQPIEKRIHFHDRDFAGPNEREVIRRADGLRDRRAR
jgi:hypothetical protein